MKLKLLPAPRLERSGKRNEIFLATKFGLAHGDPSRTVNGDPKYVKQALDKSLENLGVDWVDLYYLHRRALHACAAVNAPHIF